MRMMAALVSLVLVSSTAAAQIVQLPPPGTPPRDNRQAPAVGTSRILGRVTALDSGLPVRKAVVRISGPELRETRTTSTDVEGRYEFRDLPGGRYTITVSKGAYITLSYGQTRPFEPGRPLQLADDQIADKIDFGLPPGSVITGRVIDEYGDPVSEAVMTLRNTFTAQGQRPMPAGRPGMTNDLGEFRIFALPPGQYYLTATLRNMSMGPNDVSDDRSGYAPTYYPGTTSMAEAQPVVVGLAQTVSDITIMLSPTRTARVSGFVVDADGKPATSGFVSMIQRTNVAMFVGGAGSPIRPDGSFSVSSVAPGEYVLRASVGLGSGGRPQTATATISVSGADITNLRLAPVVPITVTGHVIVDAAGDQPLDPGLIRVQAVPKEQGLMMMGPGQAPRPVNADFSFELEAEPGLMRINAIAMQPGWLVKSVRVNGTDVTDSGAEFRSGENVDGVEIELTNRAASVSGRVTNDKGEPVLDYSAIVFPQEGTPANARGGLGRPDQDGRFSIRTLRPGTYYAAALEYVEQGRWMDPEYLEALRPRATLFTVSEGEAKSLDLKILKQP
jgi:protocatechuate 3,4-dioxygenase beta subunit